MVSWEDTFDMQGRWIVRPMNGSRPDARKLIDGIVAEGRLQGSSHFSDRVYAGEPILTTGRQMANYLPERYREMKAISRWEPGEGAGRGRWLSEAELFYRQGMFMADFEDDCPHPCSLNSYFPTYNAMSDRQLRGYFSWRTAVRHGRIEESCLSFAYVYLYELICGIGVSDPLDGFEKLRSFWQAYRVFSPEIDRNARVWLQDYVVYHGLPPHLLEPCKTLSFDRALISLTHAEDLVRARLADQTRPRRKRGASALPLPCDAAAEQRLFDAIDTLSTYHLAGSRLAKSEPEALRHVCCSVFIRMSEHYLKQRKHSLTESLFGAQFDLAYTMFGSAVFFDPHRHPDADYELDEIHRYRCRGGSWSCERYQGNRSRNAKLGQAMRATDRLLREGLGFDHPLKEQGKLPKYLLGFIEEEVAAWIDWRSAHAPVRIEVDLTRLADIRRAAADTRESLLIDEEREGAGSLLDAADGSYVEPDAEAAVPAAASVAAAPVAAVPVAAVPEPAAAAAPSWAAAATDHLVLPGAKAMSPAPSAVALPSPAPPAPVPPAPVPSTSVGSASAAASWPAPQMAGLGNAASAYLRALLTCDRAAMSMAAEDSGRSEDILVDTINEALFDAVGDTVVEYGPDGPELIDDYREDVEGFLNHE